MEACAQNLRICDLPNLFYYSELVLDLQILYKRFVNEVIVHAHKYEKANNHEMNRALGHFCEHIG